ncbi:hypothetical protein KY348_06675 [Candidatus Woesearchaeota archaeon]|nr:hypothetical protein [Candidatus Woesearchaeota archaeon]
MKVFTCKNNHRVPLKCPICGEGVELRVVQELLRRMFESREYSFETILFCIFIPIIGVFGWLLFLLTIPVWACGPNYNFQELGPPIISIILVTSIVIFFFIQGMKVRREEWGNFLKANAPFLKKEEYPSL